MLAFILLVVLGGGLGLLAVSLAESSKPATPGAPKRRAQGREPDDTEDADSPPTGEPQPEPAPEPELGPVLVARPRHAVTTAAGPIVGPRSAPRPRTQAPNRRNVPRAYTAIEGRFNEVAVAPLWRRILSLLILVVIAVAVGVGFAAATAAVVGALTELLNAAIG